MSRLMSKSVILLLACSAGAALFAAGCADSKDAPAVIAVDGSSTVFPITEAVAEEFQKTSSAHVTIGVSGTGGGFKKFCRGETAISGASRPIKPTEVALCDKNQVRSIELPVAYDGVTVVVNKANTWAAEMSVAELKKLWEPAAQSKITRWNQIRASWPDEEIHLYGPGVDSGTYDYFTKAVVGKEHASRGDFTSSEDDNVLVHGVANDKFALGFFGYAYYAANRETLKAVSIDPDALGAGKPAVAPSLDSIKTGTYQPLSRPIFIYVSEAALERPEVQSFVDFYLDKGRSLVEEVGYVPLGDEASRLVKKRLADRTLGSLYGGKGSTVGANVEKALAAH